jgi:GT2 family glycosyltransferase
VIDLGIVIVNYNVAPLLEACLNSVYDSVGVTLDVVVIDNASTDESVAMLREKFPHVTLGVSAKNVGFGAANNVGLRKFLDRQGAGSPTGDEPRYLLLLNPDTVVPPEALATMVRYLDGRPDVGAAGPKLVLKDGSLDLACRRSFPSPEVAMYRMLGLSRRFPKSRRFARYNLTFLDPDAEAEVDSVVGAFMMVPTRVVREVGLLDEDFFMYGEDLDWAYRIKRAGYKVLYNPRVRVLHHKGASSRQNSLRATYEFYRAMLVFYRKHYAPGTFFVWRWLMEGAIYLFGGLAYLRNYLRPAPLRRVS